jgi:formate dehydrogenase gamma subunit
MSDPVKDKFLRFSKQDRLQHWLLVLSFSLLALTGLVQKFSDAGISQFLIGMLGGVEFVRIIHRVAAVVLMIESVYHIGVLAYSLVVRRERSKMFPAIQDLRDAWNALLFSLGRRKKRPKYDRFSFEEKFEYWAVIWGMAIMILTGFMLWNPIATTRLLPGEVIPAAKSAHGNEALLAVLAIIIWHFYNVLVRHFNRSMYTGKLSRSEMDEFHPLELADMDKNGASKDNLNSAQRNRDRLFRRIFGLIAFLLIFGIYQFVTFEETALITINPDEMIGAISTATPISGAGTNESTIPIVEVSEDPINQMWPFSAHTNSNAEAFRHWDEDGQISAACSTCHSELGLVSFIDQGRSGLQPVSQGLSCETCHLNGETFELRNVSSIEFPSLIEIASSVAEVSMCATCHIGRYSPASIRGLGQPDEIDIENSNLGLINLHAAPVAAIFFGVEAQMAFTYEGREYAGQNSHVEGYETCAGCHEAHEYEAKVETCGSCHSSVEDGGTVDSVRFRNDDFDGDGDVEEGLAFEIEGLQLVLLNAIQTRVFASSGYQLVYSQDEYPYFFIDRNGNGVADSDELTRINAFTSFTPRLIRAAYNLHFTVIDRGAYAHNPNFTMQLLYDSIEDLEGDISTFVRP